MLTDEVKRALEFQGPGLVVCVGNPLRGDDGAGPFIAAKLIATNPPNSSAEHPPFIRGVRDCLIHVIDAETTPENHIDEIIALNPATILFIDAADFGGKPGEARVIRPEEINGYTLSTHGFPLSAVCAILAQSLPAEIRIVGIQAKDCALGAGMSRAVAKKSSEIIKSLNDKSPNY